MERKKKALTPRYVGEVLGRSQATIEAWIASGTCPFGECYWMPSGRRMFVIPEERFRKYMEVLK